MNRSSKTLFSMICVFILFTSGCGYFSSKEKSKIEKYNEDFSKEYYINFPAVPNILFFLKEEIQIDDILILNESTKELIFTFTKPVTEINNYFHMLEDEHGYTLVEGAGKDGTIISVYSLKKDDTIITMINFTPDFIEELIINKTCDGLFEKYKDKLKDSKGNIIYVSQETS